MHIPLLSNLILRSLHTANNNTTAATTFLQPLHDLLYRILPADIISILPVITLIAFALFSIVLGRRVKGIALGLAGILIAGFLFIVLDFSGKAFGGTLIFDDFGRFFSYLILIVGLFVLVASNLFIGDKSEYYSLLMISLAGALLAVVSTDLVVLFVAWELMSIPTYPLAALGLRKESIEGAIKYFIFGLTSSLIIAFGIAVLYGIAGSTNLQDIAKVLSGPTSVPPLTMLLVVSLFIVGFGFKIGLVPFHMWIPDTYQTAPGTVTAYLASGTKKVGIATFLRILLVGLLFVRLAWVPLIIALSIATMILGNLLAITQSDIARMLAYSSIAQMGYLFVGIAASTAGGIAGAIFYALVHALMKASAFISIAVIAYFTRRPVTYAETAGLGKRAPVVAFSFLIALLSLIGLPGTAGFIGKLVIFSSAVDVGLWWLALIGVLNTVLSLGYYMRLVKSIYLDEPTESSLAVRQPKAATVILIISSIMIVLLGIIPSPFLDFAYSAAGSVLSP